ncbi:MAG TPA: citrate/2-methylcitrate synthase [Spirochaetia bacterium]|nr:citrate/2-methylcitrate synthase [Spirochaetia bacterium]
MRARVLSDLLKKGDRVAVSNITGREASKVCAISQKYCGNIVGGWALGKGGESVDTLSVPIPVYGTFEELLKRTPVERQPNKILIYSPPEAVYGEMKEIAQCCRDVVETVYVVTEHVSIEVTAKIRQISSQQNIDVIGCNTLGIINSHDQVRIGAVGGESPAEGFQPGSATIISNSGNMVNTMASYLLSAGIGTSFGISTGKDRLILFPPKDFVSLALEDMATKLIVLYVEPGGIYEHELIEVMKSARSPKPLLVYVAGEIAEHSDVDLGHAGAVVEGRMSSAGAKKKAFDEYFGVPAFQPEKRYRRSPDLIQGLSRGIRIQALHHLPEAAGMILAFMGMKKDIAGARPLRLNPWFVNLGELGRNLPHELALTPGIIPEPYAGQLKLQEQASASEMIRQPMRNTSHASSNDGKVPRIYGYPVSDLMKKRSLTASLILYWTGELPQDGVEERLAEMSLVASLTNGPGTISGQGAKLSASAGNSPHTAMIATLATIGTVHGGNGSDAVKFLLETFAKSDLSDPYAPYDRLGEVAARAAEDFKQRKQAAQEAGMEYQRIPCLGHPVFRNDPVNFDPRERVIADFLKEVGRTNVFLDFYRALAEALKDNGSTRNVLAVNVDAAIACVWLGICWKRLKDKQMTVQRITDIPFIAFALGRAAGGAGEFLDHKDFGTEMDMRVLVSECRSLTRPRELDGDGSTTLP